MTPTATTSTPATSLRPQPGEYAPCYEKYLTLVQSNDILATLEDQRRQMLLMLSDGVSSTAIFVTRPRSGA